MSAKRGLGKGLEALIGQKMPTPAKTASTKESPSVEAIEMVSLDNLQANPRQARKTFEETSLMELADSIKSSGLLQPLVATRSGAGRFVLVAGERRLRAARLAGLKKVPVRVLPAVDEKTGALLGLVENLQREDLDAVEEAEAFKLLADQFDLTQEKIAKTLAKSRPYVANAMRLLDLPRQVLDLVRGGTLSAGHGRAILRLPDQAARIGLAKTVLARNLSVRETERLADRLGAQDESKDKRSGSRAHPHGWLADELRQRLGTKVELQGQQNKGRIVIHYYSEEDLTRIVEMMKT